MKLSSCSGGSPGSLFGIALDDSSHEKTRLLATYRKNQRANKHLEEPVPLICWKNAPDKISFDEHSLLLGRGVQTPESMCQRY